MGSVDFEREWLARLSSSLESIAGVDVKNDIMAGSGEMQSAGASFEWTRGAMERLDGLLNDRQKRDVMTRCACRYPESDLEDVREAYGRSGDVDEAIRMLGERFVLFLRKVLGLSDELIEEILSAGWGLAGVRDGDTIIATKIPKSSSIVDYFRETDRARKRRLYCHCPRVRDYIGVEPGISDTYCYCGAGFYKAIWEYVLDRPVEVEIVESVLSGGDFCRVAIHL